VKIRAAACLATLLSIIAITMPSSPADAAAGAACGASFTKVNIPRLGSRAKVNDVSLVSGDLGWAAANAGGATGSVAAVLRWDGTRWKPVTLPSLATSSNALGVSALSATDAWVVGYVNGTKALTLHWDGVSWTRVMPASVPGSSSVTLQAVDAAAPGDVWAVGSAEVQGATYPITMHWNGAAWSLVDFPSSGDPEWLTGVAAVDGAHAWAVGDTTPGGSSGEIGTWNGGTWVSDFYGLGMNDVTVDATGDVWAVGEAVGSGWIQTWVVHGHAGTWSWGGAVNPYGGAGDFEGVAASDDGPLWAVGTYNETNGQEAALAEVRSGHTWTWVHGPRVSTLDTQFTSVDEAGGRVVAVGYAYYEHEPALIEQICPIRITSGGFAQSAASATLGDSTVWVNTQGAGRHSVADASGIGLFDSGPFEIGRASCRERV